MDTCQMWIALCSMSMLWLATNSGLATKSEQVEQAAATANFLVAVPCIRAVIHKKENSF